MEEGTDGQGGAEGRGSPPPTAWGSKRGIRWERRRGAEAVKLNSQPEPKFQLLSRTKLAKFLPRVLLVPRLNCPATQLTTHTLWASTPTGSTSLACPTLTCIDQQPPEEPPYRRRQEGSFACPWRPARLPPPSPLCSSLRPQATRPHPGTALSQPEGLPLGRGAGCPPRQQLSLARPEGSFAPPPSRWRQLPWCAGSSLGCSAAASPSPSPAPPPPALGGVSQKLEVRGSRKAQKPPNCSQKSAAEKGVRCADPAGALQKFPTSDFLAQHWLPPMLDACQGLAACAKAGVRARTTPSLPCCWLPQAVRSSDLSQVSCPEGRTPSQPSFPGSAILTTLMD